MIKGLKFLSSLLILYGLYGIGMWLQAFFDLTIPGSVIGMVLLLIILKISNKKLDWMVEGVQPILKHLTLFFIPVTIGFIDYLDLFAGRGFLLLLIALVSTLLVMGLSGAVSEWLVRRKEQ